jgi:hypothetical protein
MDNLKITIDQLKNYLGTELMVRTKDYKNDYVGKEFDKMIGLHQWDKSGSLWCVLLEGGSKPNPDSVQPLLHRLSDLDKFIPELGFVPLKRLVSDDPKIDDKIEITYLKKRIEKLSSFEVFGWIDFEGVGSSKEHLISFYPHINQKMTPFGFMNKLFTWHFWPFGEEYFDQGLVIDKMKQQ